MAVAGVHLTRTFGETEGLFAAALDTMPTPVAILDGAGWILAVNASWRTLLRASGQRLPADGVAAEYLEIAILGALEWNHALTLRTSLGALLRGAVDRFQHLICGRREGAKHWYQVSATRIRVGGVVRIVVMHEDVSAMQAAQQTIRDLSEQLVNVQEDERRQIALELHDSTAQQLTAIGLYIGSLRHSSRGDVHTQQTIDQVERSLAEAMREIRTFSYLLHPPYLDRDGLRATLMRFVDGYAERTRLRAIALITEEVDSFRHDVQHALLRIVQEGLANVHRHASASEVSVKMKIAGKALLLSICDDGKGMAGCRSGDKSRLHTPGLGLAGMQARLRRLQGKLEVTSGPHGTALSGTIPLSQCIDKCVPLKRERLPSRSCVGVWDDGVLCRPMDAEPLANRAVR